jgi:type II secretory pathway pseudopilin PulG
MKFICCNKKQRAGFSLLEMVAASALLAGTLVPSLVVVRDSMAKSRNMHHRNALSVHASYFLEYFTSIAANNWVLATNYTTAFNFPASDGYNAIRIEITMSDDPADGGLTGQLSHVQVTAFDDLNANDTLDANESSVVYRTKIAKLNSYENEEI